MPLFRARRTDAASPDTLDRFGPAFVRLWWSSAATDLGDGALLAAGPLLVASLTDSATVVAEHVGLLVPFWSASVGVGVLAAVAWRPLGAAGRG